MASYDDAAAFEQNEYRRRRLQRQAQGPQRGPSTGTATTAPPSSSAGARSAAAAAAAATATEIPWPYCDASGDSRSLADPGRWFGFLLSDVAEREFDDHDTIISRSSDLNNVLLAFVAHHPFCAPALVQASAALLGIAQAHRADNYYYATGFLRRALYVLELSALPSFSRRILACCAAAPPGTSASDPLSLPPMPPPPHPLINVDRKENRPWFDALQALVRTGAVTG
jgi:hypothetical protein